MQMRTFHDGDTIKNRQSKIELTLNNFPLILRASLLKSRT